jgi:hypothetical protein
MSFDGQGPPQRESRPVGSGPAKQLSTPLKLDTTVSAGVTDRTEWAPPPVPTVEGYLAAIGPVPRSSTCTLCRYGTVFEDGRCLCWRHWTDSDRAALGELDRRGRAIGIKPDRHHSLEGQRAWPYGARTYVAMRRALLDWAEDNQLRYADRSHACPAWVSGADRCPGVSKCTGLSPAIVTVFDHASTWTGPHGLRLIVASPYGMTEPCASTLSRLRDLGLHVGVRPPGNSWYDSSAWFVTVAGFVDASQVAA